MLGPVYIVFAGRYPSEKAAGLFVEQNALSLVQAGADVTVLAPRRLGRGEMNDVPYGIEYVPVLDLSRVPFLRIIAHYVMVATFSLGVVRRLLGSDVDALIISNDALPLIGASLLRTKTLYEMHDFVPGSALLRRLLLSRVRWILATNTWKRDRLIEMFSVPAERILLERNAVDVNAFGVHERHDARAVLGLDAQEKLVVYTGHLYEWKGAETLAAAAAHVSGARVVFVGGTVPDVAAFRARWENVPQIQIVGHVPHDRVALWQAAADVLVLPNSAREEISVHYTSPMKLFEYMASRRPIVASDLPSIREILPENIGYFATPDNPESFAAKITEALQDPAGGERARAARAIAEGYSWSARAERILDRTI